MTKSQDSIFFKGEAEGLFLKGLEYFKSLKYDSASVIFDSLVTTYPLSQRITGALIMCGKSFYHLRRYSESLLRYQKLIERFPSSSYIDDAQFSSGIVYLQLKQFTNAALRFLAIRQQGSDSLLVRRSQRILETITLRSFSVQQLNVLLDYSKSDDMRSLLLLRIGQKYYIEGNIISAREMFSLVLTYSIMNEYSKKARELLEEIDRKSAGRTLVIGILLPGYRKGQQADIELSKEMLEGYLLAVEEYNNSNPLHVKLEIRETEREPATSVLRINELSLINDLVAIIGPLFSNEAFHCARRAQELHIPLITPTANANGIAGIGNFIFQLNPDIDTRGRSIAQFSTLQRKGKLFGILAPNDQNGKALSDAFADEIKKLNAEILPIEWYKPGATDIRSQLRLLRLHSFERIQEYYIDFSKRITYAHSRKMIQYGVPESLVDSLMEVQGSISVNVLFGERGVHIADSLGIPRIKITLPVDSLEIPVQNLDGLFLPISSALEIGIVTSQMKYFNIQSQFLGSGEWQNQSELYENRRYADGVIFTSDTYIDDTDSSYILLRERFQKKYNKIPSRNSLFAYDALKLLLSVVSRGATTREEIAEILPSIKNYRGHRSKISFNGNRVNSSLNVLQFKGRTIEKIGEIDILSREFTTTP